MPFLPPNWAFEPISFWLGFAAASFILLIVFSNRATILAARQGIEAEFQSLRERLGSGADRRHRADVIRAAESMHLAAPMFRLSELLVEPTLLAPPAHVDPLSPPEPEMFLSLPQLPDWSNLAAAFKMPGLSLADLWNSGSNILLTGEAGSGRTVALAAMALRTAMGDPALGGEDAPTPFLIHAADLTLPPPSKPDPAEGLILTLQTRASSLTASSLQSYVRNVLKHGRPLLLVDGTDELSPTALGTFSLWLRSLLEAYPSLRVIAAGPASGYGPITQAGLLPVPMQDWSIEAQRQLIQNWTGAWTARLTALQKPGAASLADPDPFILASWLSTGNAGRNPLELTLKLWAGFAGDVLGPKLQDSLEAYVRRQLGDAVARPALEQLAAALSEREAGMTQREAAELVKLALPKGAGTPQPDASDLVSKWIGRGLLSKRGGDRLSFSQPMVAAYLLAAQIAASAPDAVVQDQAALESPLVLECANALLDLGPVLAPRLNVDGDPVQRELWTVARLLKDAPAGVKWRGEVLRRLVGMVFDAQAALGLRARALVALVLAREPGVTQVLRPSLASPDPDSRRLAALGLGAMRDTASVSKLADLLYDSEQVVRWAGCLALAAIGDSASIEALATAMLQGDEELRRAAAEALARDPKQGHPILREALAEDDILLRRAAIFGLVKVGEPWAAGELKKIEMNDSQWVVRSAATEALKSAQSPADRLPKPLPLPENTPWLIDWAAKRGLGVPPGQPAVLVLLKVSGEGTPEERVAAVEALGYFGNATVAKELYVAMRDPDPLVRETAFDALHRIASAGEKLPPPAQYGV